MNKTKNTIIALVAMLGIAGTAMAQKLSVSGTVTGRVPADARLFVMPLGTTPSTPDSVSMKGGRLQAATTISTFGIYRLVGASAQRQVLIPVSLAPKAGRATLSVAFTPKGDLEVKNANADTRALIAFNDLYTDCSKQLWMKGSEMPAEQLRGLLTGYRAKADSIIRVRKPSAGVSRYLRLWAATLTFEGIESLKFATKRDAASIGLDAKAEIARLAADVDCEMALAFESASRLALATVPEGSLADRIAAVESRFKTAGLKRRAEDALLSEYISSFNYSAHYDAGLAELTGLTERFHLDGKFLKEFKKRKASIAGTPFPESVALYDLNGQKVDFSKYRGRYVYIDLWASWCIPCIKEIPHLKQLEADLKDNPNVTFLSISMDTNETAWKNKVKQLGLEGDLLINKDNKLGESLNVSGIPFFLIYDREGRLYQYNAYRPSDVRLKPLLEGLK